ncbi:REP-associated tyrosine transposase [Teredinibacter haidensis]|uniref:REP-associated tyrosine transposase n=1 Tax=Teredinibacter haidensis TaxID=2731755 RepID=UPI001C8DF1FD|nr:transposase [Teredinibacter haidensis]
MARPLRLEFAGALYHITSRGNRREDIYLTDKDRELFLAVLTEACDRYNWVCHAYCQMSNHYHLLIETPDANLSKGMRHLNGVYTQRFNHNHTRFGHVFQGRYKAILVDKNGYLLEVARYIVLNPVRAGMVRHAKDWPWSSYRATIGQAKETGGLQTEWLLAAFGHQKTRAITAYKDFVRQGKGQPSLWGTLKNQVYLGLLNRCSSLLTAAKSCQKYHQASGVLHQNLSPGTKLPKQTGIPPSAKRTPVAAIA